MQAEQPLSEHARRAACIYGAAADHYCLGSLAFWDRFGAATVSRLQLAARQTVLDLCCGAGGSALPAAHAVGPAGSVLGIDVAEITTSAALQDLFSRRGVEHPGAVAVTGQHHLDHPDKFWDVVLGSGYPATIDALSQEQRDLVRGCVLGELRARSVTALRTDAVFGTARPRK